MQFFKKYKFLLCIIFLYTVLMLSMIGIGNPNESHPFPYHMDEWHQLMAVRSLFKHGTSNVVGAANGPILFFFLSGIFLGPFYLLRIVDPFAVKSSISALSEQYRLFEVLRLTSVIFGVGSIVLVWEIARKFLKINPFITALFFTTSPVWIMLSNYFKYDIALSFFTLFALYFFYWFSNKPTKKRFFISAIAVAAALAVKISVLPLIPAFLLAYYFFTRGKKSLITIFLGLGVFCVSFFLIGIPDSVISAKAYYDFFYLNIVSAPTETANYILHMPVWIYLLIHAYPLTFGHGLYLLYILSFSVFTFLFLKIRYREKNKNELFLYLVTVLFLVSLFSLKIQAIGNRVLVLLPFMAFFAGLLWEKISEVKKPYMRFFISFIFCIAFSLQFFELFLWVDLKQQINPRITSSLWMQKNIKKQTIGLENIPIYQQIPDMALLEFYTLEQNSKAKTHFLYTVIDSKQAILPKTIIITNDAFVTTFFKNSPKKDLLARLQKDGYKEIKRFEPESKLYSYFGDDAIFVSASLIPLTPISVYQK